MASLACVVSPPPCSMRLAFAVAVPSTTGTTIIEAHQLTRTAHIDPFELLHKWQPTRDPHPRARISHRQDCKSEPSSRNANTTWR
eukprot:6190112-Pleurochrysis_carterae.AAC.4